VRPSPLLILAGVVSLGMGCPAADDDTAGDDDTTADDDTTDDDDTAFDDDSGDDDTAGDDDAGLVARIAVVEVTEHGTGAASGAISIWGIHDRPWSNGIVGDWTIGCEGEGDTGVWTVADQDGDCLVALLRGCSGDCDPPCELGDYCSPASTCEPVPVLRDAGELSIDGLGMPISVVPVHTGRYPPPTGLPADLYGAGDDLTLTAEGAATPAFVAAVHGVEPLQADLPCAAVPDPGQDLVLIWTPAGKGARVRWEMLQNIHLAQGPRIWCEAEDASGSLTVPATLLAQYVVGPHHTFTLSRYDADEVEVLPGLWVAFEVHSARVCHLE
jgi:hypothetical protein